MKCDMRTRGRGKRGPLSWGDRWRLSLATVGVLLVVGIVGVIKAPDSDDGRKALVRAGTLLLSGLFCYWMYRISGERDADRHSGRPPR
jgi:hypothetical protein